MTSRGASSATVPREQGPFFPKAKRKTARKGPCLTAAAIRDRLAASMNGKMTGADTHTPRDRPGPRCFRAPNLKTRHHQRSTSLHTHSAPAGYKKRHPEGERGTPTHKEEDTDSNRTSARTAARAGDPTTTSREKPGRSTPCRGERNDSPSEVETPPEGKPQTLRTRTKGWNIQRKERHIQKGNLLSLRLTLFKTRERQRKPTEGTPSRLEEDSAELLWRARPSAPVPCLGSHLIPKQLYVIKN